MVVANHWNHNGRPLGGDLSFKRRQNWISEIDLCIVKSSLITAIKSVDVKQGITGSDHAPLCVAVDTQGKKHMAPKMLLKRA